MKGSMWNVLRPVKNIGGCIWSPYQEFTVGSTLLCLGTILYGSSELELHVMVNCHGQRLGVPIELAIERGLLEEIK